MNSKAKGSQFERAVCKALSLWVTNQEKPDVFWRSAMSGGRATVRHKKYSENVRQCGDICSVAPEGHLLTDRWYIECKHTKDLRIWGFFDDLQSRDSLHNYWMQACAGAAKFGKQPMLIAKQNNHPILMCLPSLMSRFYYPQTRYIFLPKWGAYILLFEEVLSHRFYP